MPHPARWLALLAAPLLASSAVAQTLPQRIDALILAKAPSKAAAVCDDAEFLRRAHLDLAGRIPTAVEARTFLDDGSPEKRVKLIDKLLNSPDHPRRMTELFHVMLMERLGDHAEWTKFLQKSFAANKPWDQLAREILRAAPKEETRGAAFFYSKRLENYGQNPVDYPALTRDVGRLFLGMDLRCAQCHDHLFVRDYKQADYQGLFAFYQNVSLGNAAEPSVAENAATAKVAFMSVFRKQPRETGPKLPGLPEVEIPKFDKGKEYETPPDPRKKIAGVPKFSTLAAVSKRLPTPENAAFARNIVNRLWFVLMGRGLVHPLDLHHSGNPPSHPELLDLLVQELVAHKYDMKWLLRELALTQTYQRSSVLPEGVKEPPRESFLVAHEKRLSAEQLLASVLVATGEDVKHATAARPKFVKAFANPPREPEDEFAPALRGALFLLNDDLVLGWLAPKPGNLVDRLAKLPDDKAAEELYLSVLSRRPADEERDEVATYLAKHTDRRPAALGRLAWALLASTEFGVNH